MKSQLTVLATLAILISILRFFIEPRFNLPTPTGSYEMIAHTFLGAGLLAYCQTPKWINRYLFVWLIPSLVELFMFLYQKP